VVPVHNLWAQIEFIMICTSGNAPLQQALQKSVIIKTEVAGQKYFKGEQYAEVWRV
jgi:hypothetical protein